MTREEAALIVLDHPVRLLAAHGGAVSHELLEGGLASLEILRSAIEEYRRLKQAAGESEET
jgi:hypothetical protein